MEIRYIKQVILVLGMIMCVCGIVRDCTVFAANLMLPDNYSFEIIINQFDDEAPIVQGCVPEVNAADVPRSTNIQMNIIDGSSAVDINSIDLEVNGVTIINNGITQMYQDINGDMLAYAAEIIEKTPNEYILMYDPEEYLNYEEDIIVSISATDFEGNVLNGYSYAFRTQNFMTGSFTSFGSGGTFDFSIEGVEVQTALTQSLQGNSFVKTSKDGKCVFICWEQFSVNGVWNIYCARSTDFGKSFEMPVMVNPAAVESEQRFPALAIDSADNVYISWQQRSLLGDWDIYISKMDSSESVFGDSYCVYEDFGGSDQIHPSIAVGPALTGDGNPATLEPATVYVVWVEDNGTVTQIFYNRTTANYGDLWYEFVPVSIRVDDYRGTQMPADPEIKIDDSGRTFVAWRGANTNDTSSLYFDYASAIPIDGGESFGYDVRVTSETAENIGVDIAVSSDGNNVYLVWKELKQGLSRLKFSYYRYSGWRYVLTADRYVNANALNNEDLGDYALSIDNGRDVSVVWSEVRSGNRKICMAGASYNSYQFSEYTALSTPGEQKNPSVSMDENGGHYYVSWTDNSNGYDAIYFCRNTFIVTDEITSQKIENDIGGTITVDSGAIAGTILDVPADAIEAPITITITEVVGAPDATAGLIRVGSVIDVGPGQTFFNLPAKIEIPYKENDFIVSGVSDEFSLQIYYYNIGKLSWEILPGNLVDIDNNSIAGNISNLSMYMIAGADAEQIPDPSPPPLPDDGPPQGGEDSENNGNGNGGGGGGGCFIATAAFGTKMENEVIILCEFRDRYLLTNVQGKKFVREYYRYSPPMADYIAQHDGLRAVSRVYLTPLVFLARMVCQ
ncbi:MAG: hypothetical protein GY853_00165 [PVC group bacterium]|nr:hypothetical protein [PVC group bacterium]